MAISTKNVHGVAILISGVLLCSCTGILDLNDRKTETYARPDGEKVFCSVPPAGVIPKNQEASIDLTVAKIGNLAKGSVGAKMEAQTIREISKEVNDFEVLEYRMCQLYGSSVYSKTEYKNMIDRILPALKKKKAAESQNRFEVDFKEAKFFHDQNAHTV